MSRGDFWSRRQAAVAAEAEAEKQAAVAAQSAARDAELAEQSDEDILAALELPAPESLSEGDDFKVFLTDQVPARIKTRALRHLWRANPVLACVDGLVDYGEDFTDAACVIEGLQTAYQVGKGMTKHVEALAQEAEAEPVAAGSTSEEQPVAEPEAEAPPVLHALRAEAAPDLDANGTPKTVAAQGVTPAQPPAALREDVAQPTETHIATAPGRMRFFFDEGRT
ncbi:DUF3306 domain-containing protein [Phaeobacter sp. 11ANDIMAR09]|uniref:DUF3306 domain-containing protein n=1 Tax=Phaeobacter sp. 11ANDIMAR09 TaxID=1225647 RepID=UPI0006D6AD6F|nr:DUF3306 domain-containing protein [Phaeobacter sp. 11ANDIMAR09]KPD13619.1 hypothetical protein AN476_05385 [Phaeobacter sp. 11ANDIMAR09]